MAELLQRLRGLGRKTDRNLNASVYSVVSCSDLTPGSVEIWLDLPDEIKYDPLLAPFKQRYEQQHGEKIYFFISFFLEHLLHKLVSHTNYPHFHRVWCQRPLFFSHLAKTISMYLKLRNRRSQNLRLISHLQLWLQFY